LYGRDLPWYGQVKGAAIGWSEHKPLVDWISWLHLNEVASREELAAWVAGLEREWQITDSDFVSDAAPVVKAAEGVYTIQSA
jgi:hypothetical protein